MTTGGSVSDYSAYPLTSDAAALGLAVSTVSSALGTIVARSRKTNRSRRATIFLHGAAGSWTTWTPLLAAAQADKTPIANPVLIDLAGWGEGSITEAGTSAMLETQCSLVKASAEALGYTEWDLVGHSMGGFIALEMAARWPEAVLSVATVSATTWTMLDAARHPVRRFRQLPGFVMLWRLMQAMAHLGPVGSGLARALGALHLLRLATAPLFRHPRRMSASVIVALGVEVRPASFSAAVTMGRDYNATARWAGIECPIRAVRGDHDVFAPPADFDSLAAILPDSHRETLADCGHFAHIERPAEALAALGFAH